MQGDTTIYNLYCDTLNRVILKVRHDIARVSDDEPISQQQAELFAVIKGDCTLLLDNSTPIEMSDGDIFVLDSMREHKLVTTTPIETVSVVFNVRDYINEEFIVFKKKHFGEFMYNVHNVVEKINHINVLSKKILDLVYDIERELDNKNQCSDYVVKSHIITMIAYVMQYYYADGFSNQSKVSEHYKEIERIILFINDNLDKDLTLDDLAGEAHLNKTYLSTFFKKIIGMTIWEYILNARIEQAISYLIENKGEYNITQIAMKCGFNNSAYFNKTFKRITGKTPSEFKKSDYNVCFK